MFASQREKAYISLISKMMEFPHEIVLLLLKALALPLRIFFVTLRLLVFFIFLIPTRSKLFWLGLLLIFLSLPSPPLGNR